MVLTDVGTAQMTSSRSVNVKAQQPYDDDDKIDDYDDVCCCCLDVVNMKVTLADQLHRCADNRSIWLDLLTSRTTSDDNYPNSLYSASVPETTTTPSQLQHATKPLQSPPSNGPMPTMTFNCIADSLIWVSQGRDSRLLNEDGSDVSIHGIPECLKSADHVQVLCTGSLHLVGDILSLLDPSICDK